MRIRADVLRAHGQHDLLRDYADPLGDIASSVYDVETRSLSVASTSGKVMLFKKSCVGAPVERISLRLQIYQHGPIILVQTSRIGVIYCFQNGFVVLVSLKSRRIVKRYGMIADAGEMQGTVFRAAAALKKQRITGMLLSFGPFRVRALAFARGTCFGTCLIDSKVRLDEEDPENNALPTSFIQISIRSSILIDYDQIVICEWDSFGSGDSPPFYVANIRVAKKLLKTS